LRGQGSGNSSAPSNFGIQQQRKRRETRDQEEIDNMSTPSSNPSAAEALKQYKFVQPGKKPVTGAAKSTLQPSNFHLFVKAGLPFLLFSVGASYVLKSAVEGKNLERDKSKGLISK
jgi:hypothetical protein